MFLIFSTYCQESLRARQFKVPGLFIEQISFTNTTQISFSSYFSTSGTWDYRKVLWRVDKEESQSPEIFHIAPDSILLDSGFPFRKIYVHALLKVLNLLQWHTVSKIFSHSDPAFAFGALEYRLQVRGRNVHNCTLHYLS